ncbi:MAG: threonylcarbamoyl-AMP synthase [Paludibacteraceae bacterium]|nr:threonylcarbamoyl-AMP synthase [Paludibacteraceae bacterium]
MLLTVHPKNPEEKKIERIVDVIRNGGIVIYPTDSVYGIGCDIFNQNAVEKICKLKNIDVRKKPLSIICKDISNISQYSNISNDIFRLLKNNLPGPFTFILKGNSQLPKIFKNRKEIGVRIPDNKIVQAIVDHLDNPLMTTSIPLTENDEYEYATNAELIEERLGYFADLIIDGGEGNRDVTTVVDCTSSEVEIVRQGIGELE